MYLHLIQTPWLNINDYLLGLERKNDIDLSGLSDDEIAALLDLIKAMKRKNL